MYALSQNLPKGYYESLRIALGQDWNGYINSSILLLSSFYASYLSL
jgi:hypothetical protein